jgi:hypothetical protein
VGVRGRVVEGEERRERGRRGRREGRKLEEVKKAQAQTETKAKAKSRAHGSRCGRRERRETGDGLSAGVRALVEVEEKGRSSLQEAVLSSRLGLVGELESAVFVPGPEQMQTEGNIVTVRIVLDLSLFFVSFS